MMKMCPEASWRGAGILCLAIAATLLIGCSSVDVSVRNADGAVEQLPGLPFFTKTVLRSQETSYEVIDHVVTVEVTDTRAPDKVLRKVRLVFPGVRHVTPLAKFKKAIGFGGSVAPNREQVWQALSTLSTDATTARTGELGDQYADAHALVGNSLIAKAVVDTSRTHYINSCRPVIGEGKLDVTYNPDMTLKTVNASANDQTLGKVLDVLPVGGAFSELLGLTEEAVDESEDDAAADPEAVSDVQQKVKVAIEVESKASKVVFRKPLGATDSVGAALPFKVADGVEFGRVAGGGGAAPKKDDKNAIKINGTIQLPK